MNTGYHNNLALHIADTTLKGRRRKKGMGAVWPYTVASVLAMALLAWIVSGLV